jgi:hypothetical protein
VATLSTTAVNNARRQPSNAAHKVRLALAWLAAAGLICGLLFYGFSYYRLNIEDRPFSPLHSLLRPSGTIGLRLGMLGTAMFFVLFTYPLRKRWRWMSSLGKTRHWLDFHVLIGITAPIFITLHASFKLGGLVGVAYWIMIAVALSGFIGRYVYAQIPRSLNAAQLTVGEMQTQAESLAAQLSMQDVFPVEEIAPLLAVPSATEVRRMSLMTALWTVLRLDLRRPFQVSRLRRRVLRGAEWITTLGGFLSSGHPELEQIVDNLRRQSWLRAKMAFLDRSQQVFHLWHVIHRPFSISFAALVIIHIAVVLSLGYF